MKITFIYDYKIEYISFRTYNLTKMDPDKLLNILENNYLTLDNIFYDPKFYDNPTVLSYVKENFNKNDIIDYLNKLKGDSFYFKYSLIEYFSYLISELNFYMRKEYFLFNFPKNCEDFFIRKDNDVIKDSVKNHRSIIDLFNLPRKQNMLNEICLNNIINGIKLYDKYNYTNEVNKLNKYVDYIKNIIHQKEVEERDRYYRQLVYGIYKDQEINNDQEIPSNQEINDNQELTNYQESNDPNKLDWFIM